MSKGTLGALSTKGLVPHGGASAIFSMCVSANGIGSVTPKAGLTPFAPTDTVHYFGMSVAFSGLAFYMWTTIVMSGVTAKTCAGARSKR